MQPAGTEALNSEQSVVHEQLYQAVVKINEANDLLMENHGSNTARDAIALSLLVIAKMLIVSKAADWNMVSRLPAFK